MGGGVKVEVSGASDKEVLGIVDGGLNMREEEVIVIGKGVKRDTVNGKLEIGQCQPAGEPGVVSNGKGLIELEGEGFKKGSIGGSRNGSVGRYEGEGPFVIDEGSECDGEVGVYFAED